MARRYLRSGPAVLIALAVAGCNDGGGGQSGAGVQVVSAPAASPTATPKPTPAAPPAATTTVTQDVVASFDNPWAIALMPDGRMLVTEKPGKLWVVTTAGVKRQVAAVPAVTYSGQIGLQDVAIDPDYAHNHRIWLSYAEPGSDGQRLAVARAEYVEQSSIGRPSPRLAYVTVMWRARPATTGGQLGARMTFSPDGRFLFIATGERQQKEPAQDLGGRLGKIVRIKLDGTIPTDNPFAATAGARPEIWTLGHRNPYGLVFARTGELLECEMGPMGGDEFNLIKAGRNYGWPRVSEGDDYDGTPIPRHSTNPAYTAPLVSWTPVIAPGGMIQYRGSAFTGWTDAFVLAGLKSQGLVVVRFNGKSASTERRLKLGYRTREVEEAPDGKLWVLRDGNDGALIRLTPA